MEDVFELNQNKLTTDVLDFGDDVPVTAYGKVHRHHNRGEEVLSAREVCTKEDARCTAGLRRPHLLEPEWPNLFAAMRPIGKLLAKLVDQDAEFLNIQESLSDMTISSSFPGLRQTAMGVLSRSHYPITLSGVG